MSADVFRVVKLKEITVGWICSKEGYYVTMHIETEAGQLLLLE